MAATILRLTNSSAGLKCSGAATHTITLATDLLKASEVIQGTPTVNIQKVMWCGAAASTINITRNAVSIMDINSATAGSVDFSVFDMNETTNNTHNIVVTITGNAQIWLTLRKITGYATKIEPEQYGPTDNVGVVGS